MDAELTCDAFLGGRLSIWQPRKGYRAGVDPVLLAAATPAQAGQSVLELGCGVGVASFCLYARVSGLSLTGIEIQPDYADLARRNASENGVDINIINADLRALPMDVKQAQFDHVIANPPYFLRDKGISADNPGRETALGGDTPLTDWIDMAARRLAPKGVFTMIQRIDRLPEAMSALHGRLGSAVLQPLAARQDRAAHLFLLQARKGGRADFRLNFPLVVHRGPQHLTDGDDYSEDFSDIFRHGKSLPLND